MLTQLFLKNLSSLRVKINFYYAVYSFYFDLKCTKELNKCKLINGNHQPKQNSQLRKMMKENNKEYRPSYYCRQVCHKRKCCLIKAGEICVFYIRGKLMSLNIKQSFKGALKKKKTQFHRQQDEFQFIVLQIYTKDSCIIPHLNKQVNVFVTFCCIKIITKFSNNNDCKFFGSEIREQLHCHSASHMRLLLRFLKE